MTFDTRFQNSALDMKSSSSSSLDNMQKDMGHRPQRPGVATVIRACSPPRTGNRPPTYGKYPNGPPDVRRDWKKSKVDCLRDANIERLVGMDVAPCQNMRVTISSRANLLRKLGDMMCGVVMCVKEGGRHGALKCVTLFGLELAEVMHEHEPQPPPNRGRKVVRFLRLYPQSGPQSDSCPRSDPGEVLLDDLEKEDYVLEPADIHPTAGQEGLLQSALSRCDLYVVFVNGLLLRSLQKGGHVKRELEYAVQVLPSSSIMTVVLESSAQLTAHLGAVATALMRAPKIDVSARHFAAEEQSKALRQVIQAMKSAAPRNERNSAGTRPGTTASRLPGSLR